MLRKETYNLRHARHLRHPVSHFLSLKVHVWLKKYLTKRHILKSVVLLLVLLWQTFSTGWRRLIGCLKLQVFFRKTATNYWALLLKSIVLFLVLLWQTFSIGWRRLIGCLKLQVIFRTRATNYRAFLRKMTYEDKASYDSTPSCTELTSEKI